jgi:multicomponent Na+:H+ antiporter subunit E
VPVLVASTYVSFLLRSPHAWRWNVVGLARFLPVFVWFSLRGGLDVAQRALHPHCPLAPELLVYPLRLPVGPAQVFFANTVSLLPGTLSAELEDSRLTVHILDANLPILDTLGYLESLVSDLFGLHVSFKEPSRITCDD